MRTTTGYDDMDDLIMYATKEEQLQKRKEDIAKFPVWTLEQLKEFMHIDYDTIQKYVRNKELFKFSVGRCTYYSSKNKKYSNANIVKSILMIDAEYQIDYKNFTIYPPAVPFEEKSLIARGVRYLGHIGTSVRWDMYQIFVTQKITEKDYEKMIKLLIDIHNNNSESDYIHVVIVAPESDFIALGNYLKEASQLVPYFMCNYMMVQYFQSVRPHFKYLKI